MHPNRRAQKLCETRKQVSLRSYRPAIFNTRVSVALSLCALLFAAVVVLPFASKHFYQRGIIARGGGSANAKAERTYSDSQDRISTLQSALSEPQSAQFAISRDVIAGGGGTSSGGNPTLTLSGTIGQSA